MCFYILDKRISFFQRNIQEERFINRAIFSDPYCLLKFPFQTEYLEYDLNRMQIDPYMLIGIWLEIKIGCLHKHFNDMSCWFIIVKPWIWIISQWFYQIYILHIIYKITKSCLLFASRIFSIYIYIYMYILQVYFLSWLRKTQSRHRGW